MVDEVIDFGKLQRAPVIAQNEITQSRSNSQVVTPVGLYEVRKSRVSAARRVRPGAYPGKSCWREFDGVDTVNYNVKDLVYRS